MTEEQRESSSEHLVRRVGITVWTLIGCVALLAIVTSALAAVSELVLPFVFAVMVGAALYPLAQRLHRWMKPAVAAMVVVLGSLAGVALVAVMVVKNVAKQAGAISDKVDIALGDLGTTTDAAGLDQAALQDIRDAIRHLAGMIGKGLLTLLVGGVSAITGFVAGTVLAVLIGYYVLKDGPDIKRWMVKQFPLKDRPDVNDFLSTGVRAIRTYWAGRTVLSVVVSVVISVTSLLMGLPLVGTIFVVNFLGGYIPYLGAFIGGGLAVLLALADGGLPEAFAMLAVVLACNLLLENVLEPKIMGTRLSIHPLVVLMATTLGGILGGMVGLILAVPVAVLTIDLVRRLRAADITERIPLAVPSLPHIKQE